MPRGRVIDPSRRVDLICQQCGKAFWRYRQQVAGNRGQACSKACDALLRKKPPVPGSSSYRVVVAVGHPLADRTGRVGEQRYVLYEKIGPGPHPCHWCAQSVDWMPGKRTAQGALIVDHLDGQRQNNCPDNLVPSCHRCNVWRNHSQAIRDDEVWTTMTGQPGRKRAVLRVCEACGKEFRHLAADKRPSRGRFCSMSCARKALRVKR